MPDRLRCILWVGKSSRKYRLQREFAICYKIYFIRHVALTEEQLARVTCFWRQFSNESAEKLAVNFSQKENLSLYVMHVHYLDLATYAGR